MVWYGMARCDVTWYGVESMYGKVYFNIAFVNSEC